MRDPSASRLSGDQSSSLFARGVDDVPEVDEVAVGGEVADGPDGAAVDDVTRPDAGDDDGWRSPARDRRARSAATGPAPLAGAPERWDQRTRVANLDHVSHEAVIVLEPDGSYRFIDPGARWVLGYTREQLGGLPLTDLVHPADDGIAGGAFASVVQRVGSHARAELRLRHADGSWRWYEVVFKNLRNDPRIGGIALHLHDVTARRDAEDALRAREERFKALVQHSYDSLVVTDEENTIIYATPSVEQMFGWDSIELLDRSGFDFVHPDDLQESIDRGFEARIQPGSKVLAQFRLRHRDGTYRWVESTIVNLTDHPHVGGYVQSFRDITFRKEAEDRVRASEVRLRSLVENADGAILVLDADGHLLWMSPGGESLWGVAADELNGRFLLRRTHPDDRRDLGRQFQKLVESAPGTTIRIEGRMRHADGSWRWLEGVYANSLHDPSVGGIVVNVRDTTERALAEQALRESEAKLEYQANHDPLTGLPNRTLLFDRMKVAVARAERTKRGIAVLFCDLDNFKFVNDSHGHALGDELLRDVAGRLSDSLRGSDTAARFGGDEFVILAEDLTGEIEATMLAERINENLRAPFTTTRGDVYVTSSIGIAYATSGSASSDDLIRDADAAMYQAKEHGRARIEIFDAGMRARAVEWHQTERSLRGAISRHELRVFFQPIMDLRTQTISGVEALVRWAHPTRGLLAPNAFIGIAEQTGLVIPLGAWVLDHACTQVAAWQRQVPAFAKLSLAVNLSARQLNDETLTDDLANALAASGMDPTLLHVEITESEVMRDVEHTKDVLGRLKVLGVRVAIDDFGTGYSSFSYLRTLPVDVLKIDQSFVTHLLLDPANGRGSTTGDGADGANGTNGTNGTNGSQRTDGSNGSAGAGARDRRARLDHAEQVEQDEQDDVALVETIINLGHILRMDVVAEGVETAAQAAMLVARGCDLAQGYYYARPQTAEVLEQQYSSPQPG
jgi:diguanylate cyclase (GGDEF)-like protein/PAS domain S-box-containing protein